MHPILKASCALFFFTLLGFTSFAQKRNFRFTVLDSVDGKPLPNASIVLLRDKDSALMAYGITDSLGKFSFTNMKVSSANSFVVSFLGFFNTKIPIGDNAKNEVRETVKLVPNVKLLS